MTGAWALWMLLFLQEDLQERAVQAARAGRLAEAEALWKQAVERDSKSFGAQFNLGFLYLQKGDLEAAVRHLQAAAVVQPQDFNARYVHGAALSRLGKVEDAIREWRAARNLQPGNVKLLQLLAVEYSKARYFQEAAKAAAEAMRLTTPDENLYLIALKAHQDAGDRTGALAIADRFRKAFPASVRARFEYGYELYRAGRREEALPWVEGSRGDPGYEEPHFFLGELYLKEGRAADAIAPLRQAIAIRRDYMAAWSALARALLQMGNVEEARVVLEEAVTVNPKHPQPHLLLSQVYFRLGDESRAAQEKALSLRLRREDAGALEALPGRPYPAR